MFLSVVLVGARFLCLVSLTKLDEGFRSCPRTGVFLTNLPERVVSFRSPKIFSLFLEHNSVST